ncbi:MAG: hypothetical protein ABJQ29_01785 [Luteolibacter sp.]
MNPPNLTEVQKKRLGYLEPRLRKAVQLRDYKLAKTIAFDIQSLLRTSGHETRLMQSKNWLYEAAIEAEEYETAERGLKAIRKKMRPNTRVHLEATALLAICLLRQGKTALSEPFMAEVLDNVSVIRSESKRAEFRRHMIQRFEEEGVLNAVKDSAPKEYPDAKAVQDEAGYLLFQNASDEELFRRIGIASPPEAALIILKIDDFSRKRLPLHEVKLLPSPDDMKKQERVGTTVAEALKRRLYAAMCDKDSEIYQAWVKEGLGAVLNKLYIGGAVTMECPRPLTQVL